MQIAIVSPVVAGATGGYRKYLRECLPLMVNDPRVERVEVFCSPAVADLHQTGSVKLHTWPEKDRVQGFPWLKATIKQSAFDVVFIPSAFWLDCGSIPTVTMIRNTEPLMVPFNGNSLIDGLKNVLRARQAKQCCRRADRIIAVSEHVKEFLIGKWKIDEGRVSVIYHGVEQPSNNPSEETPPECLEGDAVGRFIFTAGSIRPARGLEDAIGALPLLPEDFRDMKLVISGLVDSGAKHYKRKLDDLAAKGGVSQRIIWTGHIKPAQMAWLYHRCELFVMTSRAEACPNTALEAMAHACRIVSTTQAPMPEFFQNYVSYYQPYNSEDLARVLKDELNATEDVKQSGKTGVKARASEFSWQTTATRTVDELERTIADSKPAR